MWVDSHCHLAPDEAAAALDDAEAAGVDRVVDVGTDLESSLAAADLAERDRRVLATAGVHPHDAVAGLEGIEPVLDRRRVAAVGECGLDYHYEHSPRAVQIEVFAAQVALANARGMALVIHSRDAWDDTFDVLDAEGAPERTVFHCFTGGPGEARMALDRGGHLSFSGIVTFENAEEIRAAAVLCPLDRLLVETDAPYLAPVPHRGRRNAPAMVPFVGAAVARARGIDPLGVAAASAENAVAVFGTW